MGGRARDQRTAEREARDMSHDYIPKVPDYYGPPEGYQVPDEYDDYFNDRTNKHDIERQDDEDEL